MDETDAFSDSSYLIYDELLKECKKDNVVSSDNPNLCITHHFDNNDCYVVVINHSAEIQNINMEIARGYVVDKVYKGNIVSVEPFDAAIFKFSKVLNS